MKLFVLISIIAFNAHAGDDAFWRGEEWNGNCGGSPQVQLVLKAIQNDAKEVKGGEDELPRFVLPGNWTVSSYMSICRMRSESLSTGDWKKAILENSPAKSVTDIRVLNSWAEVAAFMKAQKITIKNPQPIRVAIERFLRNVAVKDPGHEESYPPIAISDAHVFAGASGKEVLLTLASRDLDNSSQEFLPIVFSKAENR